LEERLFIVEGEKDVDNLFKLGIKGTTNAGGAEKWNLPNYDELVSGRPIVIIPDNDPAGKRHLEQLVSRLWGKVPNIRILNLPEQKHKGDVSDWIEQQRGNCLSDEQIRMELMQQVSSTSTLSENEFAEIKERLKKHASEKNSENARGTRKGKAAKEIITPKVLADMFLRNNNDNGFCRYRSHRGAWFLYRDNFYRRIMADDLRATVMDFLRKEAPLQALNSTRNNVIGNLDSLSIANVPSYWQPPCWLPNGGDASGWLAMKNCLLNIENLAQVFNGQKLSQDIFVRDHTPELFSSFAASYNYDPNAKCPKFENYLKGVQPDSEARTVIQMLYGLSLVPDTRYEVVFILFGESGTGKSVCLHVLEHLVGANNCCCLPLSKFTEKHSLHLLTENLLNIVGDLPTNDGRTNLHAAEGTLKDSASGGNVPIERKGKDPLSAPVIARNVFGTNELPPFADRSNGVWSRLRIIPFDQVFRNTGRDNKNLKYDLVREELPGIFIWAVHGLAKLRRLSAFPECPGGLEQKKLHRTNCDHEHEFLNEYYREYPGCYVIKSDLYRAYCNFCSENGYRPKNSANFHQEVRRVFPTVEDGRKRLDSGNVRILYNLAKRSEI
jgi:putative DNA primase/helicase